MEAQDVRTHYNQTAKNSHLTNELGEAAKVHNWIKSLLIQNCCKRNDIVLDIGCGRGGDVKKFKKAKIKKIIGIDLSEDSLQEMKQRCEQQEIDSFLIQGDAYDIEFPSNISGISCNFAFHYFLDGRQEHMLHKIHTALKSKGLFWGIMANPNMFESNSNLFTIEKVDDKSYYFTMGQAVRGCKEYVMDINLFKQLCGKIGFNCITMTNLDTYISENNDSHLKKFFNINFTVPEIHKVYTVFVLEKQ